MTRRLAWLVAAAGLAGCAAAPVIDDSKHYRPLASYASDPFVPVNLYLNSNELTSGALAEVIEYSADQLRDSGSFVRVDRGVQRWPITIQARYQVDTDTREGDTLRRVLGLMSLGLVPVHVGQTHTLFVEVLAEPESVAAMELSVKVVDRVSLYDIGNPYRGERAAADALLERMLAEITQRKLIPRWSTFKPEPKKPKVEGRPT